VQAGDLESGGAGSGFGLSAAELRGEAAAVGAPGFTLAELLVVLVILAILAAIVLPKLGQSSLRGKESTLRSDLRRLRDAIDRFENDTGGYPVQLTDLAENSAPPTCSTGSAVKPLDPSSWHGPYADDIPNDPISGAPFAYSSNGADAGKLASSAVGRRAIDGTFYTTW
jgi:general secretion pathway protein G